MNVSVTWLGHSCFLLKDRGLTAIIDPFMSGNPACPISPDKLPPIDAVLVTHAHGDHVGDAVAIANANKALCACVVGTAQALIDKGLSPDLVPGRSGFNIGGTITINGMAVTMVQAFHTTESGTPVGYVITMPGGLVIYHAGDTGLFGDMALIGRLYRPDIAMLPCGGFYTMDAMQAAEACRLLEVGRVIPMHWGTFGVLAQNLDGFTEELAKRSPGTKLIQLRPGETKQF